MTKKSPIALAAFIFAVGSTSLVSNFVSGHAYAAESAAPAAKPETIRAEMGKPFAEIQTLLTDKKYPEALAKIELLNAFENKTPYELFSMMRLRAVVASSTGNTELLAKAFEAMIATDYITPAEKLKFTEAMAGTYFNEKKYDLSKVWILRYLEKSNSQSIRDLLARVLYLQNDFAGTITELNLQLKEADAAKKVPNHDQLHLLISCYLKLKDNDGYVSVLERMVEHYPKKEYWGDLLYRVQAKPTFADRLRLDWYRLLLTTDNLEEAGQYVEMAELALLAGLPVEAKKVIDAGYAANMLGVGKDAAKHKVLRDRANKGAADDVKNLDAGEAAAKASKNGIGMVSMGYNLALNAQAEKGAALIEQGIAKGGLKSLDEAKLHLGMAYLQAGNKAKATEVLNAIQSKDGAAELAKLWLLVRPQ